MQIGIEDAASHAQMAVLEAASLILNEYDSSGVAALSRCGAQRGPRGRSFDVAVDGGDFGDHALIRVWIGGPRRLEDTKEGHSRACARDHRSGKGDR